jgi:uncharacterized protein YciI
MELNKYFIITVLSVFCFTSCKTESKNDATVTETKEIITEQKQTTKQLLEDLKAKGFKTFSYYDETLKDTVVMQQYFIAFLKRGENRSQSKEVAAKIQEQHQAHLGKMYELGYADISGPMGDDGAIRGITIYNVPTLKMADSLANSDPAVKSGRLEIELHPWWVGKGFPLR